MIVKSRDWVVLMMKKAKRNIKFPILGLLMCLHGCVEYDEDPPAEETPSVPAVAATDVPGTESTNESEEPAESQPETPVENVENQDEDTADTGDAVEETDVEEEIQEAPVEKTVINQVDLAYAVFVATTDRLLRQLRTRVSELDCGDVDGVEQIEDEFGWACATLESDQLANACSGIDECISEDYCDSRTSQVQFEFSSRL